MLSISFNYYSFSLLLGAFTAIISGLLVFVHNKKSSENQAWFALTICTAIWSFGYFSMTASNNPSIANIFDWVLHYAAIYIPLFYYLLVLIITDTLKKSKLIFALFTFIALLFTSVTLSPYFLLPVIPKVGFNYAPVPGPLYIYFFIYFVLLVVLGIVTSWKALLKTNNREQKIRLLYTIIFTISASVGGGSVFATTFFGTIPPYPIILFSLYPPISGYAILRHQLFNVRVISTQFLIFATWIFIFIRILFSESLKDLIVNSCLLFVIIILGLILIKTVKNEVAQKEKLNNLAIDLKAANMRLLDLNKQKSEFVSFATHQLRAPLTAMKGYASLILEGDFGKLNSETRNAVARIYDSSKTLAIIVDDYLNISRIELGAMKYAFEVLDLRNLVENVVAELRPIVEKSGLQFEVKIDKDQRYMVHADKDKLKQVIVNVIDNSLKYTPSGSINVSLERRDSDKKIRFMVQDTGVGISPEVMPKLFAKFTRADTANRQNIYGTGLGLYVAKEIVTAHKGKIWAESEGDGKGSKFILELDRAV